MAEMGLGEAVDFVVFAFEKVQEEQAFSVWLNRNIEEPFNAWLDGLKSSSKVDRPVKVAPKRSEDELLSWAEQFVDNINDLDERGT